LVFHLFVVLSSFSLIYVIFRSSLRIVIILSIMIHNDKNDKISVIKIYQSHKYYGFLLRLLCMNNVVLVLIFSIEGILCPDHEKSCPETATCCLLEKGIYGCCPMKNAVCCEDHKHCCPENSKCDVEHGRCINSDGSYEEMKKQRWRDLNNIVCPDKTSVCPDYATCCELSGGEYGCCPAQHAVCCSDKLHCCPEGMVCASGGRECVHQEVKSTCCPFRDGICCLGGVNCCPAGSL
uniref:GRANULINS domain-containing protein n=1 Tax=Dracunculus medinensis TaxID=318479 RepID=A0A0N4UHV8_DRAME